jgi:hypothetical protein
MLSNNLNAINFMEFISKYMLYVLDVFKYYVILTGLTKTFHIY